MFKEVKKPKNYAILDEEELTYDGGNTVGTVCGVVAAVVIGCAIGGVTLWALSKTAETLPVAIGSDVWYSPEMDMMVTDKLQSAYNYMSGCTRPITSTVYTNGIMIEEMGTTTSVFVIQ